MAGVSVSINDYGDVVAMGGIYASGTYYSSVAQVFKLDETSGGWVQVGNYIDEPLFLPKSSFLEDARAEVSLSGDGKRLAIATLKSDRDGNPNSSSAYGTVVVYEHALVNLTEE